MNLNKKELSFEDKIKELENIKNKLESGDLPLNKAVSTYEKGIYLAKEAENELRNAEIKVDSIKEEESEFSEIKKQISSEFKKAQSKIFESLDSSLTDLNLSEENDTKNKINEILDKTLDKIKKISLEFFNVKEEK
ncbi:exodeoxyribonuclease VII small subunit [Candidatus Nesciobacter abundans]|uniref:Exodeoxyribonuclease 7 small subunit n=1 Tax=Candidatus Nesciobacter abundans TaxID=2601668 RepID=A0A5C0UG05_9PROT|nr:exodeoxyribonuclease VII small subunit [Candidatus Nesciobacter abundans]QEK39036.1 exodeoxyribonuclease VII small subunit [Candidatus Nesciobacter abundans]